MSINKSNLFWGALLIGAGFLALAAQMGLVDNFPPQVWMAVLAFVGLLGLLSFALSGWKEWGWLFPAGIFGGLAVIVALSTAGVNSSVVGSPLFLGLLLPFAAAYLLDRQRNWWALIPGGVMLFLALTLLLADISGGEWIAPLFLFMLAFAFLAVYLTNNRRWWALIPAYVLGVIGIAPLMSMGGRDGSWFGPVFLLAIGLPFLYLYFRSPERWWAIIPGWTLAIVAILAALGVGGFLNTEKQGALGGALMLGGLAAVFAVIWLRHKRGWAKIVTLILGALGAISLVAGAYDEVLLSVAVILAGGYLLYIALRPRKV